MNDANDGPGGTSSPARPGAIRLRARFADIGKLEKWGYIVWGLVALAVVIPEITAAVDDKAPWPTISGMTGHLEYRWSWVGLIVVGLIVFVAFHAIRLPRAETDKIAILRQRRELTRTRAGRLSRAGARGLDGETEEISFGWLPVGFAAVVAGSLVTAILRPDGKFLLGYVLYGLIAVFLIVVPSALVFFFSKDVPFPTLFRTIDNLEGRLHFVSVLVLAGLVILLLHLALYPWPGISQVLQHQPTPHSP